jgi:hypothetical protein
MQSSETTSHPLSVKEKVLYEAMKIVSSRIAPTQLTTANRD